MELFYAEGPSIVREIKARGHQIFLDLKLHDIPNTVKKAMAVLSRLDVDMINLHAAGTRAMMEGALEGVTRPDGSRPLVIAVTQLTSTSQTRMQEELLIPRTMEETVMAYAANAAQAGLDGVVCSPMEAGKVHEACGRNFVTVTLVFGLRRETRGPGPCDNTGPGKGPWFRLYCGGRPYRCGRPGGRLWSVA